MLAIKSFERWPRGMGKFQIDIAPDVNIEDISRSLGMLLGYHLLWSTTANVVGTDEQKDRIQKLIIENNYFVGGKVNTIGMAFSSR